MGTEAKGVQIGELTIYTAIDQDVEALSLRDTARSIMQSAANYHAVTNTTARDQATECLARLKEYRANLDKKRLAMGAGARQTIKMIDDQFREPIALLDDEIAAVTTGLKGFLLEEQKRQEAEQRARQQAEQERLARERAEREAKERAEREAAEAAARAEREARERAEKAAADKAAADKAAAEASTKAQRAKAAAAQEAADKAAAEAREAEAKAAAEREAAAKAAAAEKAAAEELRTAELIVANTEVSVSTTATGTLGSKGTLVDNWQAVLDPNLDPEEAFRKLPKEYRLEPKDRINWAMVKAAIRGKSGKREIPGLKIYNEQSVRSLASKLG